LHLSCGSCNQRKRRTGYRVPARGPANRTVLLDPSAPPTGSKLSDLLSFDGECRAFAHAAMVPTVAAELTSKTVEFLNDPEPLTLRHRRLMSMLTVAATDGFVPKWKDMCAEAAIDPTSWSAADRKLLFDALDRADALYGQFLTDTQPHSSCMKMVVFERLRIGAPDFRRMSDTIREIKGVPLLP